MNGLLTLTGAEIAYLSSAWSEPVAERVRGTMGIKAGGLEPVLLAGLGSLLERALITETETGYTPGTEVELVMLGLYTGQATIEVTVVATGRMQSAAFFVGPDLRLGVVAAPADRFEFGVYAADLDWAAILIGGVEDALRSAIDALVLMQFRSATGALHRIVVGARGVGDWFVSDSADGDPAFHTTDRADVTHRLLAGLTGIGVVASESA